MSDLIKIAVAFNASQKLVGANKFCWRQQFLLWRQKFWRQKQFGAKKVVGAKQLFGAKKF